MFIYLTGLCVGYNHLAKQQPAATFPDEWKINTTTILFKSIIQYIHTYTQAQRESVIQHVEKKTKNVN